jgi:hypothetical protein
MLLQFIAPGPVDRQNEGYHSHQCLRKMPCYTLRTPCMSTVVQEEDPSEALELQMTHTKMPHMQKVRKSNSNYIYIYIYIYIIWYIWLNICTWFKLKTNWNKRLFMDAINNNPSLIWNINILQHLRQRI